MTELQFVTQDSKSLLIERLRNFSESILLGDKAEAPRRFELTSEQSLGIGVCISIAGAGFAGIVTPENHRVFIGHDCTVSIIDLVSRKVIQSVNLLGPFYEFLEWQPQGIVLAFHELGLVAIAGNGSVVRQLHAPEIVEEWHVIGNLVSLSLSGSKKMRFDLSTGMAEIF
jgi:hypothetical protein